MIVIAGIARWFLEHAVGQMFDQPQITAGVVAFHLMSGGRAAPQKLIGERFTLIDRAGAAVSGCFVALARSVPVICSQSFPRRWPLRRLVTGCAGSWISKLTPRRAVVLLSCLHPHSWNFRQLRQQKLTDPVGLRKASNANLKRPASQIQPPSIT